MGYRFSYLYGVCILLEIAYLTGFIFGVLKEEDCPISIYLPIWLIGKPVVFALCCLLFICKVNRSQDVHTSSTVFMVLMCLMFTVDLIWQLAGTFNVVFVMSSYDKYDKDSWQYCDHTLCLLGCVVMVISWLSYILFPYLITRSSKSVIKIGTGVSESEINATKSVNSAGISLEILSRPKRLSKAEIRRTHGRIKRPQIFPNARLAHKNKYIASKPKLFTVTEALNK